MADELTCPKCGKRMRYDFAQEKILCKDCGYSPLDAKAAENATRPRAEIDITYRGEINANSLAAFRTGHDYLHQGDKAKAAESFKRSAFFQKDFVDAYLWLATLSEDEPTKRKYLSEVLALDSANPVAMREIMVLNGDLTPEQAARTYHHNDVQLQQAVGAVGARSNVLLCPICSGHLTVNGDTVECKFCGHKEQRPVNHSTRSESLSMALIARKAQSVKWVIGERLLHCNECGAERTIPARKLSEECPFCGSTHVIVSDMLGSFEQPDGIVPFRITREEAAESIQQQLKSFTQRVANFFDNNRVKRVVIDGVYLPFWVFDALLDVTETRTYKGSSRYDRFAMAAPAPIRSTYTDGLNNVLVCGVTSPAKNLTEKLGKFDLGAVVAYEPKLLAKYPAELYNIDFDAASLEARSIASRVVREKRESIEAGNDHYEISIFSMVKSMSFQLLLLPVWVATLTEEDGDVRSALVNGSTGKVVLGRAEKRRN
jgi:DNA-directed RNA polymerase subunit RPC12/RpoP